MNNMQKPGNWVSSKVRFGWILLAVGLVILIAGILIELRLGSETFNYRIITGVGIAITAAAIASLIRYKALVKNEQEARRMRAAALDERVVLIRRQAGNRAFFVSMAMTYAGLMWASFASNGGLPELGGDTLWYFLAACVVIPFMVYVISIVVENQNQ